MPKTTQLEEKQCAHEWERLPQWGFVCSLCDFRPANDSTLFREAEKATDPKVSLIEKRGWKPAEFGYWRLDDASGYMLMTLDRAYQYELRDNFQNSLNGFPDVNTSRNFYACGGE